MLIILISFSAVLNLTIINVHVNSRQENLYLSRIIEYTTYTGNVSSSNFIHPVECSWLLSIRITMENFNSKPYSLQFSQRAANTDYTSLQIKLMNSRIQKTNILYVVNMKTYLNKYSTFRSLQFN